MEVNFFVDRRAAQKTGYEWYYGSIKFVQAHKNACTTSYEIWQNYNKMETNNILYLLDNNNKLNPIVLYIWYVSQKSI